MTSGPDSRLLSFPSLPARARGDPPNLQRAPKTQKSPTNGDKKAIPNYINQQTQNPTPQKKEGSSYVLWLPTSFHRYSSDLFRTSPNKSSRPGSSEDSSRKFSIRPVPPPTLSLGVGGAPFWRGKVVWWGLFGVGGCFWFVTFCVFWLDGFVFGSSKKEGLRAKWCLQWWDCWRHWGWVKNQTTTWLWSLKKRLCVLPFPNTAPPRCKIMRSPNLG